MRLSYEEVHADLTLQLAGMRRVRRGEDVILMQPEGATSAQFAQALSELGSNRIEECARGL